MRMPSVFTAPSTYMADLEVGAATAYHAHSEAATAGESDTCKPAATTASTRPPLAPHAADADAHNAVELSISSTAVAPAYQLRGELGRGQYGCVYLVEECVRHHLLAVKATYDPIQVAAVRERQRRQERQQQKPSKGSGGCAREAAFSPYAQHEEGHAVVPFPPLLPHFSNEVMCLRECHSPFIVRLEGADKGENGEDLLLMEYVDCGDLRREIRRRCAAGTPFTETEAVFVFLQLCMAVDHLHQLNILHHDLKPENVMLSSTGIIKLGDFGFAKKYREPVSQRVASTGCGTPYYLSPEALRGDRYSLKSEMWALGVILYELLALTGPFAAATRAELRAKVHNSDYAKLPATYSNELRSVCYQLLTLDPDQRPSTRDLFQDNEYLREKLNALRRISECSVNMSTEEKGSMFHSISAALRRKPPSAKGPATASFNLGWGGSCKISSHGHGSARPEAAPKPRVERPAEMTPVARTRSVC
ncbi:serine/threonine protein kinase [Leishmania donovani]|uniref:non-specific serine/threonine protein kinase n=3 Tax=Leishmania donovani species complex TaxID=38574 RepID=A0A6L0XTA3_LEIIN|nr:putative serine/threonine protein kinase [Leishmania infantum JPCM5]CAC9550279.1 serine/threonine_protein_kinase_-_putative [Leishmania infantum]CAJ1993603.1 serine/threonine protein kinase [Leishmania donovani]CAM72934.1 putative serine/threonine protein kinase [Leishmania infantum JPCM5]SUZ46615.1 serine/threonine_protein_kinase_-_putative [Leishmania infantum]VDZ49429.1 serine/threonine_protein_kinase_putative/GeneDB:LmjF.36.2290 [Leishmania donovani]|eukprot:XP_001469822.1 putative serine/threonine protein kinase [Leishmania infantum JPCM5]